MTHNDRTQRYRSHHRVASASASRSQREAYLGRIDDAAAGKRANRAVLACGNLAHGFAACAPSTRRARRRPRCRTSASSPPTTTCCRRISRSRPIPQLIKEAAREAGGIAQVAGGVPAMCDGVTQGQPGMELSLFSRDVIAMATAIGLSHNMFDAAVYLGVCDKIVPGLMIGALTFGHLPAVFIPAGPMTSGLPNDEKARSASSTPRARSAAPNCWRRVEVLSRARAPAPSTARPIPTRC
jgi:phosphogluconate dehydratase